MESDLERNLRGLKKEYQHLVIRLLSLIKCLFITGVARKRGIGRVWMERPGADGLTVDRLLLRLFACTKSASELQNAIRV